MRISRPLALLAAMFALGASASAADQKADSTATELKTQTRCPVMGGRIDSSVYTDIQGQRVYHCCPGCSEKLVADPDKYFKKASAQGVVFENVQTVCPVTGQPPDKAIRVDYDGRRVYFATDAAKAEFTKDPAKYLAVLDKQVEVKSVTENKKATEPEEHHGH